MTDRGPCARRLGPAARCRPPPARRPIVLVGDNLNTHVSTAMAQSSRARPWLTVFRLPPYAHELNPVEPVGPIRRGPGAPDQAHHHRADRPAEDPPQTDAARPGLPTGYLASTGLDRALA
ncbi:transposase [Geodermatophilus ruber]|uniref:transposase n=1 Tax=Geodermatophilus ruber TaxID=504800 RepID=UPI0011606A6A